MACVSKLLIMIAIVVAWPTTSRAQLVRSATAKRRRTIKTPAVEYFTKKINRTLGRSFSVQRVQKGLPEALAGLLRHHYQDNPSAYSRNLARYRMIAKNFEKRWRAYARRKVKVQAVVARAEKLRRKGKLALAQRLLVDVITPKTRSTRSRRMPRRAFLESIDAETLALRKLVDVAISQKDRPLLFQICAALTFRRTVSDRNNERLLWIADAQNMRHLGAGQKRAVAKALQYVAARSQYTRALGRYLAKGLYWSIRKSMVKAIRLYKKRSARRGQWILFKVKPDRITSRSASYHKDRSYTERYNCRETRKIDGVDFRTGQIYYRERCRFRKIKRIVDLKVRFASPVVKNARSRWVWIVGRVARPGLRWRITKAFIPAYP